MTELLLLGYSKHKLSTIYSYSLTKSHISHITAHDLTPLSTTATFFCPQGGDWFDCTDTANGNVDKTQTNQ